MNAELGHTVRSTCSWTDPVVLAFAKSVGQGDPQLAIAEQMAALARMTPGPPFDPTHPQVLLARRILTVRQIPLNSDGRVYLRDGHYIIEVSSITPRSRRRFTLAHELAHTFFISAVADLHLEMAHSLAEASFAAYLDAFLNLDSSSWYAPTSKEEEQLCNIGAVSFLTPATEFVSACRSLTCSIDAFRQLQKVFQISLTTAIRRVTELDVWPVLVGLWDSRIVAGKQRAVLLRCHRATSFPVSIHRGYVAPPKSPPHAALHSSRLESGWMQLPPDSVEAKPREAFTESLYLPAWKKIVTVSIAV
jgi:Zn-dependent peptidase ImmA (M78 family)